MKKAVALKLITQHEEFLRKPSKIKPSKEKGFMIHFEKTEGHCLASDYFPDKHAGEKLIPTKDEAWNLAKRFTSATLSDIVNIYVIDHNFYPISGYQSQTLKRH